MHELFGYQVLGLDENMHYWRPAAVSAWCMQSEARWVEANEIIFGMATASCRIPLAILRENNWNCMSGFHTYESKPT